MSFGIFVMLIIIIVELIAVFYMFRVGLQHDAHNDIAKVESSVALQRLSDRGVDVVQQGVSKPENNAVSTEESNVEETETEGDDNA